MSAVKSMSIAAFAAVAVLGTAYASGASSHSNAPSRGAVAAVSTVSTASTPTNAGSMGAITAPIRNIAHVYTTSATGGSGQEFYTLPNPGKGVYAASFTANFYPTGTPSVPVRYSCYILRGVGLSQVAQATSASTASSGFFVGVDGSNTLQIKNGTPLTAGCGTDDGSAWTYASRPLQVTLTRLDGKATGSLSAPTKQSASASIASR